MVSGGVEVVLVKEDKGPQLVQPPVAHENRPSVVLASVRWDLVWQEARRRASNDAGLRLTVAAIAWAVQHRRSGV